MKLVIGVLMAIGAIGCMEDRGPRHPQSLDLLIARSQAKVEAAGVAEAMEGDCDSDGLADAEEVSTYHTSPASPDTDKDSLPDGFEVRTESDPVTFDPGHVADEAKSQQCRATMGITDLTVTSVRVIGGASCTMTGFTPATCTATCTGTCCGGLFTCTWGWDPFVWAVDRYYSAPCPGWGCLCP